MTIESCLHLIFESIISEIGSNTVLAISGNVRIQKKKVSCTCVSLVFAEALLLSERGWCRTQVLSENIKPLPVVSLCSNSAWVAQDLKTLTLKNIQDVCVSALVFHYCSDKNLFPIAFQKNVCAVRRLERKNTRLTNQNTPRHWA